MKYDALHSSADECGFDSVQTSRLMFSFGSGVLLCPSNSPTEKSSGG